MQIPQRAAIVRAAAVARLVEWLVTKSTRLSIYGLTAFGGRW